MTQRVVYMLHIILYCFCGTVRLSVHWSFSGPNIALHKTATQGPGVWAGGTADKAVDGDTSREADLGMCAHTDDDPSDQSWWTVDLGDDYIITGIKIFNKERKDTRAWLCGMQIYGSTFSSVGHLLYQDPSNTTSCNGVYGYSGLNVCDDVIEIPINTSYYTQLLTISTASYLTLCEVQVFAEVCVVTEIENGNTITNKYIYKPTESVTVNCSSGYVPNSAYTTCTRSRSWDPQPHCSTFSCNITPFANGYYTTSEDIANAPTSTNSYIISHCSGDEFSLTNSGPRYCQDTGLWSGPEPICTIITCGELPVLEKGNYDAESTVPPYTYNHTVAPRCYESYYLQQGGTLQCSAMDEWVGNEAVCTLITCRQPDGFDNGSYNGSQQIYAYGSVLQPSCQHGYTMTNNVSARICNNPDFWTSDDPLCEIIRCDAPPEFDFGNYTYNSDTFAYNTQITISCYEGYFASGHSSRTCQENGQWSGPEPTCTRITCDSLPPIDNGAYISGGVSPPFDYMHEITANCDDGFYLKLGQKRSCALPNTWIGAAALCDFITCRHPADFDHGSYNGSQETYMYGSLLSPACDTGFELTNHIQARICNVNNIWSGNDPSCVAVVCDSPPNIANGNYNTITTNATFEYNSQVTVSCNDGYDITDEITSITCTENKTWSLPQPKCTKIRCFDFSVVEMDAIDTFPKLYFGSFGSASYYNLSFFLTNGSVTVKCLSNGKLEWTQKPVFVPVCSVMIINNGTTDSRSCLTTELCQIGKTLQYKCDLGFTLSSSNTTCMEDHSWSKVPRCLDKAHLSPESESQVVLISLAVTGTICGVLAFIGVIVVTVLHFKHRRIIPDETPHLYENSLAPQTTVDSEHIDFQMNQQASSDYTELQIPRRVSSHPSTPL